MVKKLLGGVRSSLVIPRLASGAALMLSVGYVVYVSAEYRLETYWQIIFAGLYTSLIVQVMYSGKTNAKRIAAILWLTTIAWSLSIAFDMVYQPHLLVISSVQVFVVARYLNRTSAVANTLLIIVATQAGYILSGTHSYEQFAHMVIHSLSLLLILILEFPFHVYEKSKNVAARHDFEATESVERERLQALINSMTDGVVALDKDGAVVVYNGSSLDILNINATLEGKQITDFMTVTDKDGKNINVLNQAQERQGYLVSRDYLLNLGEFENINLFVSISPVKIGFGHEGSEGFIMLLRDITREKSLEEERDEFISVVSHELRTPITIAEGNISNAELLAEKEKLPDGVNDSLDAAHKQVVFLSDMINDLSTLSRAERGKLKEAPEDIDIHELIKSLQRDYRGEAQQKGINLKTFIDKEVTTVFSSRLYVREILQNFITNAIKYTQEGDVEIRVENVGSRVQFAVKDSGIGISKSDQKHLFKKFFRSEDYRTRENNGTGLGLYVTMKLAKLINAQISVSSELNDGSTFTLRVPSMKNKKVEVA